LLAAGELSPDCGHVLIKLGDGSDAAVRDTVERCLSDVAG
jgi:hypothetical protein